MDELLALSAAHHHKLCPRQVLGVRAGLLAGLLLDLTLPQSDKRLIAISETDGCFVDGLAAATGCYVGRRTLRIEDYGKTAATFVDTVTEHAVRIHPQKSARELAWNYAASARNKWEAQLIGYQHIPDDLLLQWQRVELTTSIKQIVGQAGKRVSCEICGEEIINQREVIREGTVLCQPCAGGSYFRFSSDPNHMRTLENICHTAA
ncbi:MAG: formylmethanofuran dehydrogenase [Anaerolineales bacterium]|nr:formylmethanofuran dehydrogenase [Anaerolineae bacterium]PWB71856.1 MAG: formylmethanofuran dehydrogenase [Anaerolineales bacterium]